MSKKLIAVAAAAALTLTGLVGIAPSNAALTSVNLAKFSDSANINANTAAAPTTVSVPWNNKIAQAQSNATARNTTNTAIRIISSVAAGATLTINADGAARLLDEVTDSTNKYTSASGAKSFVFANSTSGSVTKTVFLYTTSTATDKFTVINGASSGVYYVKGLVGPSYNVEAKFPTAIGAGGTASVDATVTDVFGNKVTDTTAAAFDGTMLLTTLGAATVVGGGTFTWNVSRGVYEAKISGASDPGAVAVNLALTVNDGSQAANGHPAPKTLAFASISNTDLSGVVTALTAQVAALTAQLAGTRTKALSVSKKKYNSLARKWNRANPSARVALKK